MTKNYFIKTYGCQMNVHESEKLAGMLQSLGYTSCDKEEDADVIVFNTCCIRDGAETKIFGNIGALKNLKKKNKNLIIAVCGCMTQQKERVAQIKEKYPYVNIVFGTHNLNEFKEYMQQYLSSHKNVYEVWDQEKAIDEDVEMYRTSGWNAWVNIMYGCNNFCSYCIVPYVRGRERSRNMLDIHKEVEHLVQQGYKIITLLGQNVNSYGNDIDDKNITFANLLKDLCTIPGDFRIKFMSSHPKDLTDEVIDVIATNKKMSKAVHLPVQSGSNAILKAMNRKYTIEHYLELVDKLRHKIPNCRITTDIIVGFPGETEEDFAMTYDLVKKVRYSGVFAFMYSPRKGTVAASMDHQIPQEEKNRRVNKLLALSKQIIKEQAEEFLHTRQEVLVDHKTEQGEFVGILDCGKDVILNGQNYTLGQYQNIMITDKKNNQLYGCAE